MSETSTCPACDGRPKRDLMKAECCAGTTFVLWVCDLCAGEGRIDRDLAREVWRSAGMNASA